MSCLCKKNIMRQNKYEYDAFISHAVEDKLPIANELCVKLERAGLRIWYSGKELGIGDSIEKTIERGLNRSRYGIVIFSPTYLAKNWTIREFYTLLAKEIKEQKVILPVLFNITLDELKNKDLVMADRFAVNADRGIDFVVDRLVTEIKKTKAVKSKQAWFSGMWLVLILSLLANVALLLKTSFSRRDERGTFPQASFSEAVKLYGDNVEGQAPFSNKVYSIGSDLPACDCNHQQTHEQVRLQKTGQVRTLAASPPDRKPHALPIHSESKGGKMTMAVVFQFESAGDTPDQLQQDIKDILTTFTVAASADAIVPGSSAGKDEKGEAKCVHLMSFAD
jgi:hypothetical protein